MEFRSLKRRAGVAEETLRIKKELLNDAEQEYEEEHRSFTIFSQRLEEKWEQRFDALARLAQDAGVRHKELRLSICSRGEQRRWSSRELR